MLVKMQQNLELLKAGLSFEEYVPCDYVNEWGVSLRTNDGGKVFIWCVWGGDDDNVKSEPAATFLLALEGISTARQYFIMFDVQRNMMAFLSNIKNNTYRVQYNVKYQPHIVMDI
jgi:hypothetical protein